MLSYLADLQNYLHPLRLFDYTTFRAGGAALTSLLICYFLGPITVRLLKKFRTVAPSRLKGLVAEEFINKQKDKTPSMGGILIILSIVISTLLWSVPTNPLLIIFLGTLVSLACVGFLDDYAKVAHMKRDGISGKLKLFLQLSIAFTAVYYLSTLPNTGDLLYKLMIPFQKKPVITSSPDGNMIFAMPFHKEIIKTAIPITILAFIFAIVVVVGSSNAVNLTDGKDGLAVGCAIFCTLTYATFAYLCGHKFFAGYLSIPFIPGASEVAIFASAIAGACTGFLWHNCHPASMFMGDTGSLPLGGSIGLIAVLVKQELILVIVGGIFVIEAVSVMIQVFSFKVFKKRVFLCTPIHHHFEQKGWTETQIVIRFWVLSGIFALIGLATLKLR